MEKEKLLLFIIVGILMVIHIIALMIGAYYFLIGKINEGLAIWFLLWGLRSINFQLNVEDG